MDAAQLGNRLRAARDRRGLSQQAVADALGLPRTAITNIETGARAVSTLEITKLADLYGQTPAYFLSPNEKEAEDLLVVLHRALPEIERRLEITAEVGRILDLYREGAGLRGLLDQASEQTVPNYASKLVVGWRRHPPRRSGRTGRAPAFEVGIAPIVNARGNDQRPRCLDGGNGPAETAFSGLFVNHPSIGLAILVNASHSQCGVGFPTRTNMPMRCSTAVRLLRRREARMRPNSWRSVRTLLRRRF